MRSSRPKTSPMLLLSCRCTTDTYGSEWVAGYLTFPFLSLPIISDLDDGIMMCTPSLVAKATTAKATDLCGGEGRKKTVNNK